MFKGKRWIKEDRLFGLWFKKGGCDVEKIGG